VVLAIDCEATGLFPHKGCRAFMITACCSDFKTYLWRLNVDPLTREVIYDQDLIADFWDTVDQHDELVFHHANYDLQLLDKLGRSIDDIFKGKRIHDTMLASHAYHSPGPHGLKELAVSLLQFPIDDEAALNDATKEARLVAKKYNWYISSETNPHPSLVGTQREWYKGDFWIPQQLAETLGYPEEHHWHTVCSTYAINDPVRTLGLHLIFQELMAPDQWKSYEKAIKYIKPILKMEYEKIPLIPEAVNSAREDFKKRQTQQVIGLRRLTGIKDFNQRSPLQLRKVLFEKYEFEPKKSGPSGPSTDKTVLSMLLKECPPVTTYDQLPDKFKFLLDLKRLRKTNTTLQYIDNYDTHRDSNYYLQPLVKQARTGTGRIAVENPNTTNVGKQDMSNPFAANDTKIELDDDEDDDSFKLRNIFGPRKGIWTCCDYSQFQLLIFAVAAGNTELVDAYLAGHDLHQVTAEQIFAKSNISAAERTIAKNVNFGILFGAGPNKIDVTAGVPGIYSQALSRLPGAKSFLAASERQARTKGYVNTIGGYRLYVPRDRPYAASCYIIQGTEAEIVKDAMFDVSEYTYGTKGCNYRMIMMVHDELVFSVPKTNHTHLSKIISLMEGAGSKLGIPVKVEADIVRHNWSEKQSYEGRCEVCNGTVLGWEAKLEGEDYHYSDCMDCNPNSIGLIY